ncbi:MAG: hypothetical protein ACR2QM_08920, partial [Longimicrobiales bacterium]
GLGLWAPLHPRTHLRDSIQIDRFDQLTDAGVSPSLAGNLAKDETLYDLFTEAEGHYPTGGHSLAKWLVQEVSKGAGQQSVSPGDVPAAAFAELVQSVDDGRHSHHQGRRLLGALLAGAATLADAETRAGVEDVPQDDGILTLVTELFEGYPDKVAAYRAGQVGLLGFFVGEIMKRTQGKADPKQASQIVTTALEGGQ